jgi:hypothetical protein
MVERRSTFQDFAGAAISVLLLTALYGMLVWWLSANLLAVGLLVYLAVFTHSLADLIHEVLERRRQRSESALRRQMRQMQLQAGGQEMLQEHLLESLELLNRALKAEGSFVAWEDEGRFIVQASLRSLPTGFGMPYAQASGRRSCPRRFPAAGDHLAGPGVRGPDADCRDRHRAGEAPPIHIR